ncbi:4-alpha-glucanotransferase, partial [Neisseria sp. P0001.S009]|uniref:4-alpha-glucanotransferase n=1 Tax=Neisseria sp. P0001.S009 TaxID=3436653 RepID=UPI003F822CA0
MGWKSWPYEFHQPDGEAVEKFSCSHEREIPFYMWQQRHCAEQFREVNQAAAEYGVKLG